MFLVLGWSMWFRDADESNRPQLTVAFFHKACRLVSSSLLFMPGYIHPQLDLSQNRIEAALGLSSLPSLHTLNLSKNSLGDAAAVSPLSECPSLTNLDVTGNRLAGPGVLDVSVSEMYAYTHIEVIKKNETQTTPICLGQS